MPHESKRPNSPPGSDPEEVSESASGARDERPELSSAIYRELHRLARRRMAGEKPGVSLQTTALVHEAWLRLLGTDPKRFGDRAYFFAAAAEAMRRILVERARRARSEKRGGGEERVRVSADELAQDLPPRELVALDAALSNLAAFDPRKSRVVDLRYFVGLTIEETADVLGVSPRTVDHDWMLARAWLHREVRGGD